MCGVLHDESADVMTDQDDAQVAAGARARSPLDNDVEVVNLSFGGGAWAEPQEPPRLKKALGEFVAARPDVAIVAAAGNEHGSSMVWPAAFDGVLAVGALDRRADWLHDTAVPCRFSNYGPWVDVFAEGVDLLGPLPRDDEFDGWSRWSGTSFGAAVVSGRIAQIVLERGCTGTAAVAELLAGTVAVTDLNAAGTTGRWAPRRPGPDPQPCRLSRPRRRGRHVRARSSPSRPPSPSAARIRTRTGPAANPSTRNHPCSSASTAAVAAGVSTCTAMPAGSVRGAGEQPGDGEQAGGLRHLQLEGDPAQGKGEQPRLGAAYARGCQAAVAHELGELLVEPAGEERRSGRVLHDRGRRVDLPGDAAQLRP